MIWISLAQAQGLLVADPAWRDALGTLPRGIDDKAAVIGADDLALLQSRQDEGDLEDCPGGFVVYGLQEPWHTGPACFPEMPSRKARAFRVILPAVVDPPEGFWPTRESRPTVTLQFTKQGDAKAEGLAGNAMSEIRRVTESLADKYPVHALDDVGSTEGWSGKGRSVTVNVEVVFERGTSLYGFTAAVTAQELVLVEAWMPVDQVGIMLGGSLSEITARDGVLSAAPW